MATSANVHVAVTRYILAAALFTCNHKASTSIHTGVAVVTCKALPIRAYALTAAMQDDNVVQHVA